MQIVINIDEEYYKAITEIPNHQCTADMLIIKNGTLLPKVHGDLIDRSEVINSLFDYYNGKKTIGQCIDDVQTIIEVDRGVE